MAFDLKGIKPNNYDGEWIRFNVWAWHLLWREIQREIPEALEVENWFSNRGEAVSKELAETIAKRIENLGTERFATNAEISHGTEVSVQSGVGDRAFVAGLQFEMPALVKFLRNCNGFYIT